jgi:hypothetical protein
MASIAKMYFNNGGVNGPIMTFGTVKKEVNDAMLQFFIPFVWIETLRLGNVVECSTNCATAAVLVVEHEYRR